MKKLIICLASLALVVGSLTAPRASFAQDAKTAAKPHQIGLIDMAYVFKEYGKFKAMSEALKKEVESTDGEAKSKVEALQAMQTRLQSGVLAEGSADYQALEQELVAKAAELESFRKLKQRDFLRKEADIYKTVYLEVQDAVEQYAKIYSYTLIMRFSRDTLEGADNPQEIIQSMNKPVVYHQNRDDITEPILKYLNDTYGRTATTAAPAGGQRTR